MENEELDQSELFDQDPSLVLCILNLLEVLEENSVSLRLHQILEQNQDFIKQLSEYLADEFKDE
ncbi:hypothetical protein ACFLTO_01500 [Chloroflexota bacterium]